MKHALHAALVMSLIGGPALAGDWVLATRSDEFAIGVDLESRRSVGNRMTFWSVWVTRTTVAESVFPRHDYRLRRDTVDCDRSTITSGTIVFYTLNGRNPEDTLTLPPTAQDIVPDTVMDGVRALVCDSEEVQALRGFGAETANQFALDRRSGFFEGDADWLAGNPE